jgi:hypothetical protein
MRCCIHNTVLVNTCCTFATAARHSDGRQARACIGEAAMVQLLDLVMQQCDKLACTAARIMSTGCSSATVRISGVSA